MRILGEIPHPQYKITAFISNGKVAIKIEDGLLELSIRFRDGAGVENLDDIKTFLNSELISTIESNFSSLRKAKVDALVKLHTQEEDFDVII